MSLIKNNIKIEKNPFDLLEKWYKKAKKNEISNPNAMALSTVGPFNKPRTRMVLMKEIKENTFRGAEARLRFTEWRKINA